jgi:hypothetical protein
VQVLVGSQKQVEEGGEWSNHQFPKMENLACPSPWSFGEFPHRGSEQKVCQQFLGGLEGLGKLELTNNFE